MTAALALYGLTALLLLAPAASAADKKATLQAKQSALQGQIKALQKEMEAAEESRADVTEELRETEQSVSKANRRLRELSAERARAEARLRTTSARSGVLEHRIVSQQMQLTRLLRGQYLAGDSGALESLLAGQDPNLLARDAHYLDLLAQAQTEVLKNLGETLTQQRTLATELTKQRDQLRKIEADEAASRKTLLDEKTKRERLLSKLSERIRGQEKGIKKLRADEKRMATLIQRITQMRKAKVAKAKKAAKAPSRKASGKVLKNATLPDASETASAFSRLRGRLHLPVRGDVIHRFGTTRAAGATSWKGVFVRATSGDEVHAVASGNVVFSDWLRGFGNLLIVDHGEDYFTIYGNNESLLKEVGDAVQTGESVATVGNSGGNPETGLYFEIRYEGQPQDPLKWVSLR